MFTADSSVAFSWKMLSKFTYDTLLSLLASIECFFPFIEALAVKAIGVLTKSSVELKLVKSPLNFPERLRGLFKDLSETDKLYSNVAFLLPIKEYIWLTIGSTPL